MHEHTRQATLPAMQLAEEVDVYFFSHSQLGQAQVDGFDSAAAVHLTSEGAGYMTTVSNTL